MKHISETIEPLLQVMAVRDLALLCDGDAHAKDPAVMRDTWTVAGLEEILTVRLLRQEAQEIDNPV